MLKGSLTRSILSIEFLHPLLVPGPANALISGGMVAGAAIWSSSNTQHKMNLWLVAIERKLNTMIEDVTKLNTMSEDANKRLASVEGDVQGLRAEIRTRKACCFDVAGSLSRSLDGNHKLMRWGVDEKIERCSAAGGEGCEQVPKR